MITIDCPLCAGEATTDEALTVLTCDGCGISAAWIRVRSSRRSSRLVRTRRCRCRSMPRWTTAERPQPSSTPGDGWVRVA